MALPAALCRQSCLRFSPLALPSCDSWVAATSASLQLCRPCIKKISKITIINNRVEQKNNQTLQAPYYASIPRLATPSHVMPLLAGPPDLKRHEGMANIISPTILSDKNNNIKKKLMNINKNYCQRDENKWYVLNIKGCFEIIVGEIIA